MAGFDIGSVYAKIDADISGFKKAMSDAESGVDTLGKKLERTGDKISSFGKKWSVFITAPLTAAGTLAIKSAADFEQTNIAFTTMLGSAEKAANLLEELTDFAVKTPFTLSGIENSARQLLAMGIETDKLIPTLKALGDVSAGLSVDLDRVAYNFGQVKAQGQLTGVELKDFARAGVPLIAELARMLNVTEGEIKEMVSAGEIGFDKVEQAFINMTSEGGAFNDLMQKQSKTTAGQFSNLKDSVELLARSIGEIMLPTALDLIEKLKSLVDWVGGLSEQQKKWILIIGAVVAAIGPLLVILGTLVSGVSAVISIIGVLGSVMTFLIANPIALLIIAIAALYLAWKTNFLGIQDQVKALWELINLKFNQGVEFLKNAGNRIKDAITKPFREAWDYVKDTVEKIKNALDFTHRESPSVIDLVNKSVREVNKALSGLTYTAQLSPEAAAFAATNNLSGPNINNVQVDLAGAIIADEYSAEQMGEVIGDSIIKKLQSNVRF